MAEIERETRDRLEGSAFVALMLPATPARSDADEPRVKYPGISEHARRVQHRGVQALAEHMGLSAGHVCRVLRGERQSRKVLEAARTSGLVVAVERRRA